MSESPDDAACLGLPNIVYLVYFLLMRSSDIFQTSERLECFSRINDYRHLSCWFSPRIFLVEVSTQSVFILF